MSSASVPNPINELLYQLIVRQLEADGHTNLATQLARSAGIHPDPDLEPHRLRHIVEQDHRTRVRAKRLQERTEDGSLDMAITEDDPHEVNAELPVSKPFPKYVTKFVTIHKSVVQCAKFSQDGEYLATGSADCSIKLMQTKLIHFQAQVKGDNGEDYTNTRPVVRTFYDHNNVVMDLDFHPIEPFLVSCSKDSTIKFFEHAKVGMKRSYRHIIDTHPARSVNFHPSGDFLLVGTEHCMIRLYDINTFQSYVAPDMNKHHLASINLVRYANQGNVYASCSDDGTIKIWDAVNNVCVNTIKNAHTGSHVDTIEFSPSGKYLLSCGKDSTTRLWELGTGKEVMTYTGAVHEKKRTYAAFSHSGDFVLSADETDHTVVAWDTRTGELVRRLKGHNNTIKCIAASPSEMAFASCSQDTRCRFWSASAEDKQDKQDSSIS